MALSLHCQHGKKLNVECSIFLLLIDLNDFPLLNIKDIRLNFHCFSSFLIIFNKLIMSQSQMYFFLLLFKKGHRLLTLSPHTVSSHRLLTPSPHTVSSHSQLNLRYSNIFFILFGTYFCFISLACISTFLIECSRVFRRRIIIIVFVFQNCLSLQWTQTSNIFFLFIFLPADQIWGQIFRNIWPNIQKYMAKYSEI